MNKYVFILAAVMAASANAALAASPSNTDNGMDRGSANPVSNEINGSIMMYPPVNKLPRKAHSTLPQEKTKKQGTDKNAGGDNAKSPGKE